MFPLSQFRCRVGAHQHLKTAIALRRKVLARQVAEDTPLSCQASRPRKVTQPFGAVERRRRVGRLEQPLSNAVQLVAERGPGREERIGGVSEGHWGSRLLEKEDSVGVPGWLGRIPLGSIRSTRGKSESRVGRIP